MTDGKRRLAGRYRIDGLLGRGGMSEVYYGYDERLDRFLREIRMTARLELSGVPAVYDSGVDDSGVDDSGGGSRQLWLVMQLLRGASLETLLDGSDFTGPAARSVA